MKIPPQLIMLAVVGVGGSVLFAAESDRQAQLRAVAMAPKAEVDPDKKLPSATDEATGKPGDASKSDASKTDAAKADAKADAVKSDAAKAEAAKNSATTQADKAAEKPAAEKGAATAKSGATPQRFVPSEEVRADFDVSFPVDI